MITSHHITSHHIISYVCICIYTCKHVYIHIYICVSDRKCANIYIYMFTCTYLYAVHMRVCVYVHVGIAIHCLSEGDEKVQYYTYTII